MNKDLNKFGITEATMLAMAAKSGVKYRFGDEGMRCMLEYSQSLLALAASGGNAAPGLTDEQIDTPEFMDLLNTFAHESSCEEYDETKYKEARHALVNHIKAASAPNAALVAACTEGAEANLPDFMDWIADRLEFVYGESPNVDFVRTCRDRAKKVRAALSAAGQEVK